MGARVLGLTALALLAQTPQFRSGVDVARFDVVVLDKARQPIAGLTAADFRVTEDGRPLRVAGFEAVTIPGAAGPPDVSPAAPADLRRDTVTNKRDVPGRLVVIVLDRTIGSGQPVVTARNVANAALDSLGPNDLAAVVFTSGLSGNRPQGFTAERARLRAAVASLIGTPTAVIMTPNGLRHDGPAFNLGECHCGICAIEKLALVADALASVDGYRKMILFIGDDLPMAEDSAAGRSPSCAGLFGDARDHLMQTVERANVTVHSFNPRGLETGATGADAFHGDGRPSISEPLVREGNLRALPEFTGGRSVQNTNQPERLVPAVFDESRAYYVLAVERAPARPDRRPHRVKIEVARPDATVVSRTAYLDPQPPGVKKASAGPGDPLERALGELLPRTDLPLRMTLAPGTAKNTVDVTLATPLATSVRADVVVGVFDEFSKQVGTERASVELPARGGGDVEWKMHLNPKPGRYEVRAAVRIGDRVGTVIGHVEAAKPTGSTEESTAAAPPPSAAERKSAALDELLARAGDYLEQYGDPSNGLLLEEKYAQHAYDTLARMRELKSELLILPDATEGWLEFRDVLTVDGKAVADRQDRLQQLFSGTESDPRAVGRRIADEGARYNLNGSAEVKRTLNHPMVPLLYLRAANQPRSEFALEGNAGRDGQHVTFTEVRTPALIGTAGDQTATGEFWIDPATGRVRSAVLRVVSRSARATVTATIRVRYKDDPKIGLMVPDGMEEHYAVRDTRGATVETIDATAWYSKPRQFKASAGGGQ